VKKVSFFKKNILYYINMDEGQTKTDDAGFEESLRQILSNAPSGGRKAVGGSLRPPERPESGALEAAGKAETESKAIFWFKLMRPLAMLALVALLAMFVLRITAARG
jgi:hypothetical protein